MLSTPALVEVVAVGLTPEAAAEEAERLQAAYPAATVEALPMGWTVNIASACVKGGAA